VAILRYFEIVRYQIYANLKAESARGGLGILWWAIDPLLYMVTFYFVFEHILHRGGKGYVPFLITGLIVWKWFASSVTIGATSIEKGAALMRQVHLPKFIFPLISVLTGMVKFLIVLFLLFFFLFFSGIPVSISWTSLPLLIISQFLFILCVAGIFAIIVPYFSDLNLIITNALMLGLFLSGIFYDIESKPEKIKFLLKLNPMASLIIEYRKVLIKGLWPDFSYLAHLCIISLIAICFVYSLSYRFDRIYPKIIS
jgi:lipopolysaccharide transport system permease protein